MKNTNYPYYAILVSGSNNNVFTLRKVISAGTSNPVDGKRHRTESRAIEAADQMGIEITKVGSFYEII